MRVIAGSLGGRHFDSPKGHRTHPMSEKIRGALFAVLGDIKGLCVLDAYSGSGAISIEAISRGASKTVAVDSDKNAILAIRDNLSKLKITDDINVCASTISSWSLSHHELLYDLIIADPPFDHIRINDIQLLPKHLSSKGTFVLSWPDRIDPPEIIGLAIVHLKNYGDAQLAFYKPIS